MCPDCVFWELFTVTVLIGVPSVNPYVFYLFHILYHESDVTTVLRETFKETVFVRSYRRIKRERT